MRLDNQDGSHITIDDANPIAQKIMQGHSYTIVKGQIQLGPKTGYDVTDFRKKLKDNTATLIDIQEFILKYILK